MLFGQKYSLTIENSGKFENNLINKIKYKKEFTNNDLRKKELNNILLYFYESGYLTASYDSLCSDSNHLTAFLNSGEKYRLYELRTGNIDKNLLNEVGYKNKLFTDKAFNYTDLSRLCEKIIVFCENHAYPFASIRLDSIEIKNNLISASLNLEKNNKIIIDSIITNGNVKISQIYLTNYLGIKPGDDYNEEKIRKISIRLKELKFIKENKAFKVLFTKDKAQIELFLEKKKANQFDGIIGFSQDNNNDGKLTLKGELHINLLNSFNRGELIDLKWRKLESKTQDLKFNFNYPYIFSSQFGIDYSIKFYKQDSTYFTLYNNFGLEYLFSGKNRLKVFMEVLNSSIINTQGFESYSSLPEYADTKTTSYGLYWYKSNLDYIFNPRKGYEIEISGAIGEKKIEKNDSLPQHLYDSLSLNSTQFNFHAGARIFIPIFNRSTFLIQAKGAVIENENLFDNELFRFGGLKSLRGFDEESLKASFYSILLLEYRYIISQNSYINLFWNASYYEKDTHKEFTNDTPWGFGAGISFETRLGIFSLIYSLGKQFNNPIEFSSAKVHFGLINRF